MKHAIRLYGKFLAITIAFFLMTGCSLNVDLNQLSRAPLQPPNAYHPATGTLDTSFGGKGFIQQKIVQNLDMPDAYNNIVRDEDDNIYLAGVIGERTAVSSLRSDGSVNTSFGKSGYVFFPSDFVGWEARINLVRESGINYLLVTARNQRHDIVVQRLNMDGSLDQSFEKVTIPVVKNKLVDKLNNVLVHSDGSYFFLYSVSENTKSYIYVAKLKPDRSIDASYGTDGTSTATSSSTVNLQYKSSGLDKNGNIFILARVISASSITHIWKINSSGTADSSFGSSGRSIITTTAPIYHTMYFMDIDDSSRVWIFGNRDGNAVVYRLTAAGNLDVSFNSPQGSVQHPSGTATNAVRDNNGYRVFGENSNKFTEWYVSDTGQMNLINTPATAADLSPPDGYELSSSSSSSSTGTESALTMSNGDIIWFSPNMAYLQNGNSLVRDSLIYGISANGETNLLFNSGQPRIFNERLPTVAPSQMVDLKVSQDGKIYIANALERGIDGDATIIYRYDSNGKFDTTYGTDGYYLIPKLSFSGLAIDSKNRAIIQGSTYNDSDSTWRLTANGQLDSTFGVAGKLQVTLPHGYVISQNGAENYPIAIDDADNIYSMVYYYEDGGSWQDKRALWKIKSSGQIDANFGSNSLLDLTDNNDSIWGITQIILKKDGFAYLTSFKPDFEGAERVALAKLNMNTGIIDESFGDVGIWKLLIGPQDPADDARGNTPSLTIDSQDRFLITTSYITPVSEYGDPDKEVTHRFTSDGDLDTTFNSGNGITQLQDPSYIWLEVTPLVDGQGRVFTITSQTEQETYKSTSILRSYSSNGITNPSFGNNGAIDLENMLNFYDIGYVSFRQSLPSGSLLLLFSDSKLTEYDDYSDILVLLK